MRIGLLTYGLDRAVSGVGRVGLELMRALALRPDCQVAPLGPGRLREGLPTRGGHLPGCSRLPGLMLLGGPLIAVAARRLRLEAVHDPIGVSPFTLGPRAGRFRRVVTIHDAIAFRYPEGYPWLNNFLHRRYVPATLRNVDAVITDSQHAASDLQRFLKLPAERIRVVPLGVGSAFRPVGAEVARVVAERHGLEGPFVLSVAAQQARKNLPRLLEAFALLRQRRPELRLALAGPSLWRYEAVREQVAELGLGEAVRMLGYVPDEDLPALYSAASVFAFPSLYEGFGLPVLEAMACGTPVVCSNSTSLPEVAGEAALLVDPYDVEAIAKGLERAMEDEALRCELRGRGLERARAFSWERTARENVRVYREVLER